MALTTSVGPGRRGGDGAGGVADQGGGGGGDGAASADVAEQERPPAVFEVEDVVEVATDVESFAGGVVVRGDVGPGDVGKGGQEQAGLQVVGEGGAVGVLAGVARG
ncbi:hypothetical protein [Streptomyces cyaneofuscatus]|uniref:hypothetical protein n=1 Tax=Streptomyces cyaneofuscatus TaxID=66883 RepID=UPI0037B461E1